MKCKFVADDEYEWCLETLVDEVRDIVHRVITDTNGLLLLLIENCRVTDVVNVKVKVKTSGFQRRYSRCS